MAASYRDRAVYYRALAALLGAGAPATVALKAAADGVGSSAIRDAATDAAYRAGSGVAVAEALAHHPEVFEESDVALLRSAEMTGDLDRALLRLAEDAEVAGSVGRRLKAGLVYPVILWHLAAVVPPLQHLVLDGFGAWLARVLVLLIPFYAVLAALAWLGTSHRGRVLRSRILGRLPFVGRALRQAALARFCRVLAGALDAGMSAVEAATAAFSATTQAQIRRAARTGIEILAAGNPFSRFFGFIPELDPHDAMILATAEKTGDLSPALRRLAEEQEERARTAADAAARYLPLIVYLLVAGYMAYTILTLWVGIQGAYPTW